MKIRELQLINYRAFGEHPPFQFSDQFTVIAGNNGRGKTSILDSIALTLGRLIPQISIGKSGYPPILPKDVHKEAEFSLLKLKVICGDYPINFELRYDRETKKIRSNNLTAKVKQAIKDSYWDSMKIPAGGEKPLQARYLIAPIAVYYTTNRAGYSLPKKLPREVPRGQAAAYAGALRNRTVNFKDFMTRFRAQIALDEERYCVNLCHLGTRAVEAITAALYSVLDGFSGLRVEENPLRLMIDKGETALDLTQLSDGERSFLALICDLGRRLALANPMLDNPLHGPGVVLIDELELHMHPKWQREVVDKLRQAFPKIQFIATTHSPFVVQSLQSGAELILLDGHPTAELGNKGIEEIARGLMGVPRPDVSERYEDMKEAARDYLELLEEAAGAPEDRLEIYKQQLAEGIAPYAANPAFQAFLEMKRIAKLGE